MTTCLRVFESVDSNDRPSAVKLSRPRSRKALSLAASVIALSLASFAQSSYAAEGNQAASENLLPEVIVTSQFRQQNVQSTPIAITAVNAAMLDARGQTNIAQVAAQAPNVTLAPQGQARQPRRRRETEGGWMAGQHGNPFSVTFTEQGDDLPDLDDLLVGGQDEGGQAFPGILPQETQPAAGGDRRP